MCFGTEWQPEGFTIHSGHPQLQIAPTTNQQLLVGCILHCDYCKVIKQSECQVTGSGMFASSSKNTCKLDVASRQIGCFVCECPICSNAHLTSKLSMPSTSTSSFNMIVGQGNKMKQYETRVCQQVQTSPTL